MVNNKYGEEYIFCTISILKNITINMVYHIYGEEYAPKMRAGE
jgi:hypothetical protein